MEPNRARRFFWSSCLSIELLLGVFFLELLEVFLVEGWFFLFYRLLHFWLRHSCDFAPNSKICIHLAFVEETELALQFLFAVNFLLKKLVKRKNSFKWPWVFVQWSSCPPRTCCSSQNEHSQLLYSLFLLFETFYSSYVFRFEQQPPSGGFQK